jgi:hypothetical protein
MKAVSSQTRRTRPRMTAGKPRSGTAGQAQRIEVSQRDIPIRRGPEALRRSQVGITLLLLADS